RHDRRIGDERAALRDDTLDAGDDRLEAAVALDETVVQRCVRSMKGDEEFIDTRVHQRPKHPPVTEARRVGLDADVANSGQGAGERGVRGQFLGEGNLTAAEDDARDTLEDRVVLNSALKCLDRGSWQDIQRVFDHTKSASDVTPEPEGDHEALARPLRS